MEPPPNLTNRGHHQQQSGYDDWGNDSWDQAPQMDYAPQMTNNQGGYPAPPVNDYNPYMNSGHDTHSYGQPPLPPQQQQNYGGYNPGADMMGQMGGQAMMNQMMSAPVMSAAQSYGEQFAKTQSDKIIGALSASHLKYFFQVDNTYVGKKLALLVFPFAHSDWSVSLASESEPTIPKNDINAPDLYIPVMALVTYITLAGVCIGLFDKFSPEQLGLITSNVLAWLICEMIVLTVTKYVMNISQSMSVWTSLAFSMYKFVGMTACLTAMVLGGKQIYYIVLAYCSLAIVFFLIRSVKSFVMDSIYGSSEAGKRKLYLIAYIALTQPFIMWWLTSSVISYAGSKWTMSTGINVPKSHAGIPDDLKDIPEDILRADGVIP